MPKTAALDDDGFAKTIECWRAPLALTCHASCHQRTSRHDSPHTQTYNTAPSPSILTCHNRNEESEDPESTQSSPHDTVVTGPVCPLRTSTLDTSDKSYTLN